LPEPYRNGWGYEWRAWLESVDGEVVEVLQKQDIHDPLVADEDEMARGYLVKGSKLYATPWVSRDWLIAPVPTEREIQQYIEATFSWEPPHARQTETTAKLAAPVSG
jgi:hypothetical protein